MLRRSLVALLFDQIAAGLPLPPVSGGDGSADNPTPEETMIAELKRYPELLPGGAEALGNLWRGYANMPPDRRAEKVAGLMTGEMAKRYINSEYVAPKLENGQPYSPLRQVLQRFASDLAPGAVDKLVNKWSSDLVNTPVPRMTAEVVNRLAHRDNREYLAAPGPLPAHEVRIASLVWHRFSDVLSYQTAQKIAREQGNELAHLADEEIYTVIARTLKSAAGAHHLGATKPLDATDGRLAPPKRVAGEPVKSTRSLVK